MEEPSCGSLLSPQMEMAATAFPLVVHALLVPSSFPIRRQSLCRLPLNVGGTLRLPQPPYNRNDYTRPSHKSALYFCLPLLGSLWEPSFHAGRSPHRIRGSPCGGEGRPWAPRQEPAVACQPCEGAILSGAPAWSRGVACLLSSVCQADGRST